MTYDEDPGRAGVEAAHGARTNEPEEGGDLAPVLEPPATGDPALDEMLLALAQASAIALEDQLPVIEAVHRGLQDRLADVEG